MWPEAALTGGDVPGRGPDRKWSRAHAQPVPALFSYYSSSTNVPLRMTDMATGCDVTQKLRNIRLSGAFWPEMTSRDPVGLTLEVTLVPLGCSHPVAMSVMRNGTFCTTMVRKKAREPVAHAHVITSVRASSGDVTSGQGLIRWRHFRLWPLPVTWLLVSSLPVVATRSSRNVALSVLIYYSRMSSVEYLLQKTYKILWVFCILLKCCKSRNRTVGKAGNKQNDKNWFYQRTSEHWNVH
jgi:hypothetical protein